MGGGTSQSVLDRIKALETDVSTLTTTLQAITESKASKTFYGLAKLSDAADVTEDLGLVLSAKEKNPAVDGTLARGIKELKQSLKRDMAYAELLNGVTGTIALYRMGSIIFFATYFDDRALENKYNWKSGIGLVPEGYRPLTTCTILSHYDGQTAHVSLSVRTDGRIDLWCQESAGGILEVTSTYFTP